MKLPSLQPLLGLALLFTSASCKSTDAGAALFGLAVTGMLVMDDDLRGEVGEAILDGMLDEVELSFDCSSESESHSFQPRDGHELGGYRRLAPGESALPAHLMDDAALPAPEPLPQAVLEQSAPYALVPPPAEDEIEDAP